MRAVRLYGIHDRGGSGAGEGDQHGNGSGENGDTQEKDAGKPEEKNPPKDAAAAAAPQKPRTPPSPAAEQKQEAPRPGPIKANTRSFADATPRAALLPTGTPTAASQSRGETTESGSGGGGGGGFFGVQVKSGDRIIFLLDVSGSMTITDSGCQLSRHQLMRNEMIKCLDAGYKDAIQENGDGVYLIVCFSNDCIFFPASQRIVNFSSKSQLQQARDFVRKFQIGGGTDMLAAWQKIVPLIKRHEIRTVCFLSDGDPTDCSPEGLLKFLKHSVPRLRIHTFSMGKDSELLKDTAKQHKGTYRKIN